LEGAETYLGKLLCDLQSAKAGARPDASFASGTKKRFGIPVGMVERKPQAHRSRRTIDERESSGNRPASREHAPRAIQPVQPGGLSQHRRPMQAESGDDRWHSSHGLGACFGVEAAG